MIKELTSIVRLIIHLKLIYCLGQYLKLLNASVCFHELKLLNFGRGLARESYPGTSFAPEMFATLLYSTLNSVVGRSLSRSFSSELYLSESINQLVDF